MEAVTFARRLTEARERLGVKPARLAKLAGVTGAWVSKAESGKSVHVQAETLFAVARVLQVNPQWLADGTGPRDMIPLDLVAEFSGLSAEQQSLVRSLIQSIKK